MPGCEHSGDEAPASTAPARCGMTRLAAATVALTALAWGEAAFAAPDCRSAAAPGVDWEDCDKANIVLRNTDLQGARLFSTDFTSTDLRGANLTVAILEKATLVRASLAGAKADQAHFDRIEAYRANFSSLAAEGASFAGAELQRVNFHGAQLQGASFEKAELGRANFADADLTGARFALANLSRADFRGATAGGPMDFSRAFLFLSRIEGLDLSRATGLEQQQIELACGDAGTRLPEGLRAPDSWPCAFE